MHVAMCVPLCECVCLCFQDTEKNREGAQKNERTGEAQGEEMAFQNLVYPEK